MKYLIIFCFLFDFLIKINEITSYLIKKFIIYSSKRIKTLVLIQLMINLNTKEPKKKWIIWRSKSLRNKD